MNWLEKGKDFFTSIPRFLGEVKAEMKKVSFPTRVGRATTPCVLESDPS